MVAGLHQGERGVADGALEGEQKQREHGGHPHGTREHVGTLARSAGSVGLGGDAAGAHAQEGAVPVDHRKDGRADGEGGDVGVVADAPGDRGVGHAQQRDGDVRDDVRQRQT